MLAYGNIPICINIVTFPYVDILSYSNILTYGNVPICMHMGIFPYVNIWDYYKTEIYVNIFLNFSNSSKQKFPCVIMEITCIEIVPICYDIIVTLLLVLFIVR